MYMYIYIYIYTCMYIYIYIYICRAAKVKHIADLETHTPGPPTKSFPTKSP